MEFWVIKSEECSVFINFWTLTDFDFLFNSKFSVWFFWLRFLFAWLLLNLFCLLLFEFQFFLNIVFFIFLNNFVWPRLTLSCIVSWVRGFYSTSVSFSVSGFPLFFDHAFDFLIRLERVFGLEFRVLYSRESQVGLVVNLFLRGVFHQGMKICARKLKLN